MPAADKLNQAILFADIAGSTRLYVRLGDDRASRLVKACMDQLALLAVETSGTVIKTIGDEVMIAFDTPDQAAAAAADMQEWISSDPQMASEHVQLRIGLHHGPVIRQSGDLFGDAVNMAAHMVDQAKAGQIIASGQTVKLLARPHRSCARLVDRTRIKGKWIPVDIYELSWGRPEEQTMITAIGARSQQAIETVQKIIMVLTFDGQQITVGPERPLLMLGRDAANNIVINDPRVSRWHARIELRRKSFILVDQSTNGTFVIRNDGHVTTVRREELPLPEIGLIGLGQPETSGSPLAIRFHIIPRQEITP